MERYFITSVDASGGNTKNEKGKALYRWVTEKYESTIINNETDLARLKISIEQKMEELSKEYPTLKQGIHPLAYPDFGHRIGRTEHMNVYWNDKNHTQMFYIAMQKIKE